MQTFMKKWEHTSHHHFTVRCYTPRANTTVHDQHNKVSYLYLPQKNKLLFSRATYVLHPSWTCPQHTSNFADQRQKLHQPQKKTFHKHKPMDLSLCELHWGEHTGFCLLSKAKQGWADPGMEDHLEARGGCSSNPRRQHGKDDRKRTSRRAHFCPTVNGGGQKENNSTGWWPSSSR